MPAKSCLVGSILFILATVPIRAQAPTGEQKAPEEKAATEASSRSGQIDPADFKALKVRSLGPATMEGRIVDLAVSPEDSSLWLVAAATGGVFRTTNHGTTFDAVLEHAETSSIGAVAFAPFDAKVAWVGTGEANFRNSVSTGAGVYKSEDSGATFQFVGLRETRHIGRIAIHPKDSQVVFIAALGRAFGPNPERGIFRTRDGGKSFEHVLSLDEDTGAIDVLIDPHRPSTVYACAYAVRRDAFDGNDPAIKTGPKAGLYRSIDEGTTWERLASGLPTRPMGRSGLTASLSEPGVLYAVIETDRTGQPPPQPAAPSGPAQELKEPADGPAYLGVSAEDSEGGARITQVQGETAAERAGLEAEDVIQKIGSDVVTGYESMIESLGRYKVKESARIALRRGQEMLEFDVTFGPKPFERAAGSLGGQLENRQDRQGPLGFETGGIFRSRDFGSTWERINSLNPRPFYYSQIRVDPTDPLRMWVLGTQLHYSTDGGKTFKNDGANGIHVDHHALWIDPKDSRNLVLGNDGGLAMSHDRGKTWEYPAVLPIAQFYDVAVDQRVPYRIYGGLQDNGTWGFPSRTRLSSGLTNDLTFKIGQGDGFVCAVDPTDQDTVYCESQNGNIRRVNVRTGEVNGVRRPPVVEGEPRPKSRFNWKTPFFLSPHNPHTIYFGGAFVYRSVDRGLNSVAISDELGLTERGTASAMAESPKVAGVLWVGTDDGSLQVSRDGGIHWTEVHENLPEIAGPRWVSHIETSRVDAGTALVVLDGHRSDDDRPHVFRTRDFGKTFERLTAGLPNVSTRVVIEDPANAEVLYLGTEIGLFLSLDAGLSWMRPEVGLPTAPVHDLVLHERDRELVIATHGRSVFVLDVGCVPTLAAKAKEDLALFPPKKAIRWHRLAGPVRNGSRHFRGDSPPEGAEIWFWLAQGAEEKVKLQIETLLGDVVHEQELPATRGLNRATWNLRSGKGKAALGTAASYRAIVKVKNIDASAIGRIEGDPLGASLEGAEESR